MRGAANPPLVRAHSSLFLPPAKMTTVNDDSAKETAAEALPPESTENQLSEEEKKAIEETTDDPVELKAKLAAAESDKKMWKGRAEKATKPTKEGDKPTKKGEKPLTVTEADVDWKILNANRVNLVKDAYEKEISELKEAGATITNQIREKALNFAEISEGVKKPQAQGTGSEPLPVAGVQREETIPTELTSTDKALGVKQETKEEFREYVEG